MNLSKELEEDKKIVPVGKLYGDIDGYEHLNDRRIAIRKAMDQRLEEKNYYFNDMNRFVPNE